MSINIGITENNTHQVAFFLNKILADEFVLYLKTRKAHWNIEGLDFYDKHKFFQSQYEQIDQFVDDLAERIRTIGHYTPASLSVYLQLTHLTERSRENNDANGFITELLKDNESIIIKLREYINPIQTDFKDIGTADFITSLLEKHEKMAWLLRSHLK